MARIITDPIGDMLIRIKNANQRKHRDVKIPYSKIKETIVKLIKAEGYIFNYKVTGEGVNKEIVVSLKYAGSQRVISGVKRISKPSLRVYVNSNEIPQVLSGFGTVIISTSQGMTTGKDAKAKGVGGEVVAYIW